MCITIVDGIPASGKSLYLHSCKRRHLSTNPNYSIHVLTEHFTERFLEKEVPINGLVAAHVLNIISIVKNLQRLHTEGPFSDNKDIQTIYVERLFLTLLSKSLLSMDFFDEN